jgi:NAD(P)-dependent dehydrogenase (short-subunit alcohol dehydrogenase family)
MVRVSLLGVVYCCHAALPVMRAQGCGHIVVAAPAGGMARGAIDGFCDDLRAEVAPLGVKVSVVEGVLADALA